jgi:hypothetical protein
MSLGAIACCSKCDGPYDDSVVRMADFAYFQKAAETLRDMHMNRISALEAELADYKSVLDDKRRLTRELDVLLNGAGAAKQASLCDIVSQVRSENIRSSQFL